MADDLPRGRVSITSTDPELGIRAHLIDKPDAPRRPRYQTQERPGRVSINRYVGQDPVEQTLVVKFDGTGGDSVEDRIRTLEQFLRPVASNDEPPVLKVRGDGVLHPGFDWRMLTLDEDRGRRKYVPHTGDRMVYVATVTLRQHVDERQLAESLRRLNRRGQGRGITNRTVKVRQGENSLYDVSRRVYNGDPSRATDIARANGRRLGARLKPGTSLRIP